jgi:MSHA pilin protein MshA
MPANLFKLKKNGFTLIELIVVIAIMSLLSVIVLPKFSDVGKDARIASLKGLQGTLISTANMAQAKCLVDSGCDPKADGGQFPSTVINGQVIYFHYGYPTAWGRFYVDDGAGGINELISYAGFTYLDHVPGSFQSIYTKDGAPDVNNCKVVYQMAAGYVAPILTVSIVTTGC